MNRLRAGSRGLTRPRRGQSMIEFALVLPIFLLIVFGLFDIGRIVFLKVELENAVREGARTGRVLDPFNQTTVQNRVKAQPGLANATVSATCNTSGCPYGSRLTVTATLPVQVLVGLVPALPSPNLTASASVRIE
jgi:Flp pilus assembly protein TadG